MGKKVKRPRVKRAKRLEPPRSTGENPPCSNPDLPHLLRLKAGVKSTLVAARIASVFASLTNAITLACSNNHPRGVEIPKGAWTASVSMREFSADGMSLPAGGGVTGTSCVFLRHFPAYAGRIRTMKRQDRYFKQTLLCQTCFQNFLPTVKSHPLLFILTAGRLSKQRR
jgi:hypothetical protein